MGTMREKGLVALIVIGLLLIAAALFSPASPERAADSAGSGRSDVTRVGDSGPRPVWLKGWV